MAGQQQHVNYHHHVSQSVVMPVQRFYMGASIDATTTWYQNLIRGSNLLNNICRNLNFMVT